MDELRNALHAAAAEPPPTRIDLDELIDGTRRRSRLQYRIALLPDLAVTGPAVRQCGTPARYVPRLLVGHRELDLDQAVALGEYERRLVPVRRPRDDRRLAELPSGRERLGGGGVQGREPDAGGEFDRGICR